jgi:hypothetical protein
MEKASLPLIFVLEEFGGEDDTLEVPVHVLGLVVGEAVALVVLGLDKVLDLLLLVLVELRVVALVNVVFLALDGLES